ncbi:hypothetical protein EJ08DRAFT_605301 [Tothia fuscella]|uniref:CREG-like beta-barrel domain-containing protein n=1 Tax=Tothia fuscella TaxID=1048955 RepID=A0A9P4U1J7_9PEZI|nr:hypothetical protein EJ08DRAFT_605301 [Tothia fuscella]
MILPFAILSLLAQSATCSLLPWPQHIFSNPTDDPQVKDGYRIPTVRESAVMARRMLRYEKYGTLSTVFPETNSSMTLENRPDSVGGSPLGLMEYFADCEPSTGNPTILAITITSSYKNVMAGSNITLSLRWHPNYHHPYSPAKLPRFALVGTLETLSEEEIKTQSISSCYSKYHPDVFWKPGNDIHESIWVRLAVKEIYWFGGFGDRAYIGWISKETWTNVTEEEIQACRLPGEHGTKKSMWNNFLRKLEL